MNKSDVALLSDVDSLHAELRELIASSRQRVAASVNTELTQLYWAVGARLSREVLAGERAKYGAQLMLSLAQKLEREFGRGFEVQNLRRMVQFAQAFSNLEIVASLMRQLSWTHFLQLIPIKAEAARYYYADRSVSEGWSVRELRRQIDRKSYERSQISGLEDSSATDAVPAAIFKDPYFLDFLGLSQGYDEADLESAILMQLKSFILELGKGFAFVERKKRMMELYLKWLDRYERQPGEEAPIGLILCAESSREQVELLQVQKDGITVAEYWTELPPRAELERQLRSALAEARERLARRRLAH
jgi:predicted nuclease of restriction endonuclease-like (RecB) superfamily